MTQPQQITFEQAIALGIEHQNAGRLQQAEAIYRQILAVQPNHADALHLLGSIAVKVGRLDVAEDLMRRAIASEPRAAIYHSNLGLVMLRTGRADDAIVSLRQSLLLDPHLADAHYNLGNALAARGNTADAVESYQHAIQLRPALAEQHNNLANALRKLGKQDEAEQAYRRAIEAQPDYAEAHNNLGNLLQSMGRLNEALSEYRKALSLRANFPEALNNLGNALQELGDLDQAIDSYRKAIEIAPGLPTCVNNLGTALHGRGDFDEAIKMYDQSLQLQPDWALAHCHRAVTLLVKGDLRQGFAEHEWRRRSAELAPMCQHFPQPMWDGTTDLNDQRVLLHSEQGFGDTIQFVRYAPILAERGAKVIIQCQTELLRLLAESFPLMRVIAKDAPLPRFDLHCPLLSLPFLMKTDIASIPSRTPYLRVDPDRSAEWRLRLTDREGRRKVGICFAGRRSHNNDRNRSMPLDAVKPLLELEGVRWVSLQKDRKPDFAALGPALDLTDQIQDFADTAALIDNLDLIVTVDTAVAHLAGALGKPVLLLLPLVPDWRWMLDRNNSPWYPTMQLLRQTSRGDWSEPVAKAIEVIRKMFPGVQ